jgi:hypothetical protein
MLSSRALICGLHSVASDTPNEWAMDYVRRLGLRFHSTRLILTRTFQDAGFFFRSIQRLFFSYKRKKTLTAAP